MKAITIKQPWASLIVEGIKDIENRTWKTNFRGRVLIHTAAMPAKEPYMIFNDSQFDYFNEDGRELQMFKVFDYYKINSLIIGSVEIVDCVINYPSIWAEKTPYAYIGKLTVECQKPIYNWVLAKPIKFTEPIPAKGKLNFWDYPGILKKKFGFNC